MDSFQLADMGDEALAKGNFGKALGLYDRAVKNYEGPMFDDGVHWPSVWVGKKLAIQVATSCGATPRPVTKRFGLAITDFAIVLVAASLLMFGR